MTAVQTFVALITHPRRAFTELEKEPRFAVPMWLLVIATIGTIIWFYSSVNVDALITQRLAAGSLTKAQRAAAAGLMSRGTFLFAALIAGTIALFVVQLVTAFYFFFVCEFLEAQLTFRKWFAFAWWCSVPQLISVVITAVLLLVRDPSQASPGVLSPLSLNELFFHYDQGDNGYALLNSITLVQLLTLVLMVIGVQVWTKRSWLLSFVIVIAPRLVIYGVWYWFSFLR
jgi:hypothetical protein